MIVLTMGRYKILLISLFFCLLWTALANAEDLTASRPVLESISGSLLPTITLNRDFIPPQIGMELPDGSRIRTGKDVSATLLYPDGSRVVLFQNTDFIVEGDIEGTQWNKLNQGKTRGIIKKINLPASTKPRFLIRSKTAVLGVRGTEFLMEVDRSKNSAQISTLEGTVDVARSEMSLMNGQGVQLTEGRMIESSGTGFSETRPIEKNQLEALPAAGEGEPIVEKLGQPVVEPTPSPPPLLVNPQPAPPRIQNQANRRIAQVENEEKKGESPTIVTTQEEKPSRFRLLAFQTGLFYAKLPDSSVIRAIQVAWTPIIPVPLLYFLTIRGQIGGSFAQQGSLNQHFFIKEFQIFLTASLFDFAFAEVGVGEQIWQSPKLYDAGLKTANVGLLMNRSWLNRIYVGYQVLNTTPKLDQYRAGIGISF